MTIVMRILLCAVVAIICYGYTKHKSEQKSIDTINIKMENNNNLRKLLFIMELDI